MIIFARDFGCTRAEQISVPPEIAGENDINLRAGWTREVLNVFANNGGHGTNRLCFGTVLDSRGLDHDIALVRLRCMLDAVYDRAEMYSAAENQGLRLQMVIIEIRVDGDVNIQRIQDLELHLADCTATNTGFPRSTEHTQRPFVNLAFTTRPPVP